MSTGELGETFDIHTGGEDLICPHHEDEIAQSEGATGKPFARSWLHVKHLLVNGEKMSKSKRNDYTIAQLVQLGHAPAAIRYLLLQAHYRRELNFSFDGLEDARVALKRLVDFKRRLDETAEAEDAPPTDLPAISNRALAAFEASMDDDLNTPNALAALFPFVREVNAALDQAGDVARRDDLASTRETLRRMDDVLGVIGLAHANALDVDHEFRERVEALLRQRQDARGRRDFAAADAIRDQLLDSGVRIEDTPSGPRWTRR
jgi:cysteinyl-tRNA synthetase